MCVPTICLTALLIVAGPAVDRGQNGPPVDLELVTEQGFPLTGSHDWSQALTRLGIRSVRVRSLRAGEVFQPRIEETGTRVQRRYRVDGLLTARNTLKLPGGTFRLRELARLKQYLESLGSEGPEAVTTKKERFGLTLRQLAELTDALTVPLDVATRGADPVAILRMARQRTTLPIVVEPDARGVLDQANPAVDEVHGLSLGTALAAILGRDGLILLPRKRGLTRAELIVARANPGRDAWPVGWPPQQPPYRLAPALFAAVEVNIAGHKLAETLPALESRVQIPFLLDHQALARQRIAPARIRVSFPPQRTSYQQVVDQVLFQARLKSVLRVDEAGKPLLWITTIQGHPPAK